MPSPELLFTCVTRGPEGTRALGERLGGGLHAGEVLLLDGELGSGKTVFVQGLALGLGVEGAAEVCSPSYLVVRSHPGEPGLLHMDAYFARRAEALAREALAALEEEGAVLAVEWAASLDLPWPREALRVEFRHLGPERRSLAFRGDPQRWRARLAPLAAVAGVVRGPEARSPGEP